MAKTGNFMVAKTIPSVDIQCNTKRKTKMTNYDLEVKQRFGETEAYKEYQQKTTNYTKEKMQGISDGLMDIFAKFSLCLKNGNTADSNGAHTLAKELQDYITENYYTCTKEILAGLGQMYVADERFKQSINKNGDGTAEFVSTAIEYYTNC